MGCDGGRRSAGGVEEREMGHEDGDVTMTTGELERDKSGEGRRGVGHLDEA